MANFYYIHNQFSIEDFINYPVVAHPDAVMVIEVYHFFAARWSWVFSQFIN